VGRHLPGPAAPADCATQPDPAACLKDGKKRRKEGGREGGDGKDERIGKGDDRRASEEARTVTDVVRRQHLVPMKSP